MNTIEEKPEVEVEHDYTIRQLAYALRKKADFRYTSNKEKCEEHFYKKNRLELTVQDESRIIELSKRDSGIGKLRGKIADLHYQREDRLALDSRNPAHQKNYKRTLQVKLMRNCDVGFGSEVIDSNGSGLYLASERRYSFSGSYEARTLFGRDETQMFAVRVCSDMETVEQAVEWLMPAEAKVARDDGRQVFRQGDWYFLQKKIGTSNFTALEDSHEQFIIDLIRSTSYLYGPTIDLTNKERQIELGLRLEALSHPHIVALHTSLEWKEVQGAYQSVATRTFNVMHVQHKTLELDASLPWKAVRARRMPNTSLQAD